MNLLIQTLPSKYGILMQSILVYLNELEYEAARKFSSNLTYIGNAKILVIQSKRKLEDMKFELSNLESLGE